MPAKFHEIPSIGLQDIKETKRYGRTHGRTDGQRENSIPPLKLRFGGGYNKHVQIVLFLAVSWPQANEPHHEKTGLRGLRPGLTHAGLYTNRRKLESKNFGQK